MLFTSASVLHTSVSAHASSVRLHAESIGMQGAVACSILQDPGLLLQGDYSRLLAALNPLGETEKKALRVSACCTSNSEGSSDTGRRGAFDGTSRIVGSI